MNAIQRAPDIEALFLPGVLAFETRGGQSPDALFPSEIECVARAVEKRVREFAAGRVCARAGLAALGIEPAPILVGKNRAPVWPAGIVGSITHTEDYCLAVVARQTDVGAIGIDAERLGKVDPSLWHLTMRPEEIEALQRLDESERATNASLIFSAKEAFYKCQHTLTRSWLGFEEVVVRPAADTFELSVIEEAHTLRRMRDPWAGRFMIDDDIVVAAIAADAQSSESAS